LTKYDIGCGGFTAAFHQKRFSPSVLCREKIFISNKQLPFIKKRLQQVRCRVALGQSKPYVQCHPQA
jgi:hypothetical protein